MAKIISRLAGPDDPMYREGLQSYAPHWTRTFLGSEYERRKRHPHRQQLVRKMLQDHPEWDPQEIEELHRHLDSFE